MGFSQNFAKTTCRAVAAGFVVSTMFVANVALAHDSDHETDHQRGEKSRLAFFHLPQEHQDFMPGQFDLAKIFKHDVMPEFRHQHELEMHDVREDIAAFLTHEKHEHDYFQESSGDFCQTPVPAPVPEPSSVALLLAGLGLMGVAAKRRKYEWSEDQY